MKSRIEETIKKINSLNHPDDIYYLSPIAKAFGLDPVFERLRKFDLRMSKLSNVFEDSDVKITRLKEEQKIEFNNFKKQLRGFPNLKEKFNWQY